MNKTICFGITPRETKTSFSNRRPWNFTSNETHKQQDGDNHSFLSTHRRKPLPIHYMTIDFAEAQMNRSFKKQQMNKWVQSKIKKYSHFKEQQILSEKSIHQKIQDPEKSINSPKNFKQMKISSFLRRSLQARQRVVPQSFFINSKEKISRVLQLSQQKQQNYEELKHGLQKKIGAKFRRKQLVKPSEKKRIVEQEWDKNWQEATKLEITRYNQRLRSLHNKNQLSISLDVRGN